jgi:hypothetical protein
MSSQIEREMIDLVNKVISNEDLPRDRIKSLKLTWQVIYGELTPDLQIEFYED